MPKMIFVNLPVADLAKSVTFYEALGATKDERFCDSTAAMMVFSETITVMLLTHARFSDFTPKRIANARETTEVLICLSAESRDGVDDLLAKAGQAGGVVDIGPKQDHGFMYGRSFEDVDGHIWEVAWMDVEAAMKAHEPAAA